MNDNLVLISGATGTGKSLSFMGIQDPKGVFYANCESGKKLPFKSKFQELVITDPKQIYQVFTQAETEPSVHTIIVDSLTFLLDMFETVYVTNAANGMSAWAEFQTFFKVLMQEHVAKSTKNVIFTAHTLAVYNEADMAMEVKVPVKGALKNNGIEAYFSTVISTKKMKLADLEKYESKLLTITEEETMLGFKYVFQTKITKDTVNERIRGPFGLFDNSETFTDNNTQLIIDRLHEYYG